MRQFTALVTVMMMFITGNQAFAQHSCAFYAQSPQQVDLQYGQVVERQVEDEFGKLRSLTEEESKLQDKEMKETIEGLSNTIDEYNFFFEDERIERLEGEVANYWTEIEDLST